MTTKNGYHRARCLGVREKHFRSLGKNIQTTDFSVVGIGDMSGDVFGNGMLLTRHTRLLAAFDHRHIFIDPDPDIEKSFAERARMFSLPRSSWMDYDQKLISKGGGIYARTAKSITLSAQARQVLGIDAKALPPNDVIRAILRAGRTFVQRRYRHLRKIKSGNACRCG